MRLYSCDDSCDCFLGLTPDPAVKELEEVCTPPLPLVLHPPSSSLGIASTYNSLPPLSTKCCGGDFVPTREITASSILRRPGGSNRLLSLSSCVARHDTDRLDVS